MQVNPTKCIWFADSVEYLSFVISQNGIKSQSTKIQGIINMKTPTLQKKGQQFVSMVNFSCNSCHAEILAPLTTYVAKSRGLFGPLFRRKHSMT
jgi:hypothetical protein